jgi:hypothetical protein
MSCCGIGDVEVVVVGDGSWVRDGHSRLLSVVEDLFRVGI